MEKVAIVFTVFFEDPFWCGVYQRQEGTRLEAARVVFGQEPKDYEVLVFLLQNWKRLRFGRGTENRAEGQIQRGKTGRSRTKVPTAAGKASGKTQRTLTKGEGNSLSLHILKGETA